MCLHGALSSVPFNLIGIMTSQIFSPFDSTPGTDGERKDRTCACMVLYAQFPLI